MILPASNRADIFALIDENKKQILAHGFFTSEKFDNCELICKTLQKYEELPQNESDRIFLKVAMETDSMELALSTMNPVYVSYNTAKGSKECQLIFNEDFNEAEDVMKKDESKARLSRRTTMFKSTSKISKTTAITEDH